MQNKLMVNPLVIGDMNMRCSHLVLYVKDAQLSDQGRYECRSYDHTGKTETADVFVRIHRKLVSPVQCWWII